MYDMTMKQTHYIAPALRVTSLMTTSQLLSNSDPEVVVGNTPTNPSVFGTKGTTHVRYNVWDDDWSR